MQQSLDDILQLDKLDLPPHPVVDEIHWYAYTDSIGEPAYRITVILADDTPPEHRKRQLTRQIEDKIFDTLQEAGADGFPYIRTLTRADLEWAEKNR